MRMFPPQWSEKTGRSIPYSELLSTSCLNAHLSDYHHFPPSITPLPTTITVTTIHSDGGAAFSHGDSFTTHRVRVFSFSYLLTKLWSHQHFATRFLQICNWTIHFVQHHPYHIYIIHFKWLHNNMFHFFWCDLIQRNNWFWTGYTWNAYTFWNNFSQQLLVGHELNGRFFPFPGTFWPFWFSNWLTILST